MTEYPDDEQRWVDRRAQYLSANKIGLRVKTAEAVAWSELGYSASGIAEQMDVTTGTGRKYLDRASKAYPGICLRTYHDIDGNPEAGVDNLAKPGPRQCPVCRKDRLCSVREAEKAHSVSNWGATSMLEKADLVCSWCHSVRIGGSWQRMQEVGSRARELASGGGSKTRSDYKSMLTAGIQTTTESEPAGGLADPDEVEW